LEFLIGEEEGVYEDIECDTKKKSPIKGITYEEYLKLEKDFGVSKTKQATYFLFDLFVLNC
jgi:hypothetical protein